MQKTFSSESALSAFAESLGHSLRSALVSKSLPNPLVFELVGDVGAGKTTFTRALAKGLGVAEAVTSPSFSISKRYAFPLSSLKTERLLSADKSSEPSPAPSGILVHYDFYRLDDPGIMSSELEETLTEENAVIVVEWADSVASFLPASRIKISFKILGESERELSLENFPPSFLSLNKELA